MWNTSSENFQYLNVTVSGGNDKVTHTPTGNDPRQIGIITPTSNTIVINWQYDRTSEHVTCFSCAVGIE